MTVYRLSCSYNTSETRPTGPTRLFWHTGVTHLIYTFCAQICDEGNIGECLCATYMKSRKVQAVRERPVQKRLLFYDYSGLALLLAYSADLFFLLRAKKHTLGDEKKKSDHIWQAHWSKKIFHYSV